MEPAARWWSARNAAPASLLRRVRWLFLLFVAVVTLASLASVADSPGPFGPRKAAAALALLIWLGWAVYRYLRPDAALATDAVPLAALLSLGLVTNDPGLVFAPAFVSLFFRAMFGSRAQVLSNGLGYFAVSEILDVAHEGAAHLTSVDATISFISFIAIALVMQALGATAAEHERVMVRERLLTRISRDLLRARSVERAQHVAVDGARQLAGTDDVSASLWQGVPGLELVASAGAGLLEITRLSLDNAVPTLRSRFMEGAPYLTTPAETRTIEASHGHPHRFEELLIAPLVHEGEPWGTIVLASTTRLPSGLVEIMGRFANEVSLAVERARLVADLEQANSELRRANLAKDQFVSTVSHELRTPLTSICGFATTLRRRWHQLDPAEVDRYLEVIERQGQNQQRLVEDLLTTSRILADRLPIAADDVPVHTAIAEVLDLVDLPQEDVRIRCPADLVAVVDPNHLQQTFSNLLSNAAKYGEPPYDVDVAGTPDEVIIHVTDRGTGVDPSFRARLFEPFAQADEGNTRTASGVGLGLAIVRSLVDANGGSIDYVDAGPSVGACFEVRLPRGRVLPGDEEDRPASEVARQPTRSTPQWVRGT